MQEMVELSKMQAQQAETKPQTVTFTKPHTDPPERTVLLAGPAQFGPELQSFDKITGKVIFTNPSKACTDLINADKLAGKIAIADRGNCMFIEKVRSRVKKIKKNYCSNRAYGIPIPCVLSRVLSIFISFKARRIQQAGALAGIILDNVAFSSAATSPMFAMSGDGKEVDDVTIPVVFLFFTEAVELTKASKAAYGDLTVTLGNYANFNVIVSGVNVHKRNIQQVDDRRLCFYSRCSLIAGAYSSKEEVQLKAPTDLSLFERLKGSLKSFLSRHVKRLITIPPRR